MDREAMIKKSLPKEGQSFLSPASGLWRFLGSAASVLAPA